MAVVIVTGDSYCHREEIAEQVAAELGYSCVGTRLIVEASRRYQVEVPKLVAVLEKPSAWVARFARRRNAYLAYLQATLLSLLNQGDTVFHGPGGHMWVEGVSHVAKVALMADLEYRAGRLARDEGIDAPKATRAVDEEATARKKWSLSVFGVDELDASLNDLVVNVGETGPEDAVKLIVETVRHVRFRPITYSIKSMADNELASRVRAELIDEYPDVQVKARDGDVRISSKALSKKKEEKVRAVKERVAEMEGVSYVEIRG